MENRVSQTTMIGQISRANHKLSHAKLASANYGARIKFAAHN